MRTSLLLLLICGCVEHDGEYYYGGDMATHNVYLDNIEGKIAKPYFAVYPTATQGRTDNTQIRFSNAVQDTANAFDLPNNKYVVPVPGVWVFGMAAYTTDLNDNEYLGIDFHYNGGVLAEDRRYTNSLGEAFPHVVTPQLCAVGDQLKVYARHPQGGQVTIQNQGNKCVFWGLLLETNY